MLSDGDQGWVRIDRNWIQKRLLLAKFQNAFVLDMASCVGGGFTHKPRTCSLSREQIDSALVIISYHRVSFDRNPGRLIILILIDIIILI